MNVSDAVKLLKMPVRLSTVVLAVPADLNLVTHRCWEKVSRKRLSVWYPPLPIGIDK